MTAVQNLQQRLGDDSSGAAGAIKKLGINLEQLKQQGPYQQLITLATAIETRAYESNGHDEDGGGDS